MIKLNQKEYLLILFILSIISLTIAFIIEYILGYQPCNLCILERIPYALTIIILIINYKFKKNQVFYNILLLQIFAFSILISLYHLGIEQGLVKESSVCISDNTNLITKENILNSLKEFKVSCKDVTFRFFNLSLTTYNMFLSIIMFLIALKVYLIKRYEEK
tara:strand:- start:2874 stop:3359 length:486 start_codon:yes stop_codon:yes gene_type:complete